MLEVQESRRSPDRDQCESWLAPLPDLESGRETEKTEVESENNESVCTRVCEPEGFNSDRSSDPIS